MENRPTYSVAVVGVGKIARDQHLPSIARSPRFALAAAVSRHARVEGVETFDSLERFLAARPDVPVVALCTPPQVRCAMAEQAIRAGRHVLLEKPPGATVSEVEWLARYAEQAGVSAFATWHSRFAPGVEPARAVLAGRETQRVRITWKEDVRRWHPGQAWIWEPGGLGVFDPGINALSMLTAIMPHPLRVVDATLSFPENRQTPIAASLRLVDHLGTTVEADLDWRQEGPQTWEILAQTRSGCVRLSAGGAALEVDGTMVPMPPEAEYDGLYARLADLLDKGESEMDVAPLRHVADAFLLGARKTVAAFHDA